MFKDGFDGQISLRVARCWRLECLRSQAPFQMVTYGTAKWLVFASEQVLNRKMKDVPSVTSGVYCSRIRQALMLILSEVSLLFEHELLDLLLLSCWSCFCLWTESKSATLRYQPQQPQVLHCAQCHCGGKPCSSAEERCSRSYCPCLLRAKMSYTLQQ